MEHESDSDTNRNWRNLVILWLSRISTKCNTVMVIYPHTHELSQL